MTFTDEQVMLTLAALSYRGFHDVLGGRLHEGIVTASLLDGLTSLAPVRDEWDLVWGPATGRGRGQLVDSSAMYVVRDRRAPSRYVVAIRGTNPISLSDWLLGDLWVGETVDWPYAPASEPAAISKSTALGLAALQAMRSRAPDPTSATDFAAMVARTVSALGRPALSASGDLVAAAPAWLEAQIGRIAERLQKAAAGAISFTQRRSSAATPIAPADLRPTLQNEPGPDGSRDLLTFLRAEAVRAAGAPMEVVVTGHSKGAALAQAVAVWLKDAVAAADLRERWAPAGSVRVACYAFAGPTPGNTGFARRIERLLGEDHHHLRNTSDLVTHAWQADEVREIPALYGRRSAIFERLIASIATDIERLGYRHAQTGATRFSGALDARRDLAHEAVFQHLDAYLAQAGLHDLGLRAITFFV